MADDRKRLFYFDNLKSAIIMLIVAFHCAMSYMKYAPDWWYVLDSQRALPFTWFVIWADNFIMPVMFFISGYFALKSLRSWAPAIFWAKKLRRIALPWLIGMVFFVPYMIWLWFFSRDIPISLYDLIVKQYFGPFYQRAHSTHAPGKEKPNVTLEAVFTGPFCHLAFSNFVTNSVQIP